jgi:hypothetical protein
MLRKLFGLSAVALAFLLARAWESRPIDHPPGILVPESPRQLAVPESTFELDDYLLTRKASFNLRARVLSKENYYLWRESDLSPVDLALGWGVMSDQAVLDRIEISQSGRWYRTRYDFPAPVSDQQIIISSSNMHMIPATGAIKKRIRKLRRGDIVHLAGYLVNVAHDSGWRWQSSLRRDDTGAGACELFYVEQLRIE